jgi:hypothetical protein
MLNQDETVREWIERLRRVDQERADDLEQLGEVVHTVRFAPPRCPHVGCPSHSVTA